MLSGWVCGGVGVGGVWMWMGVGGCGWVGGVFYYMYIFDTMIWPFPQADMSHGA